MYALFMIYIPSKIQGSTPYSKSLVFLDQCVHSKGNNTKVNSHCISSDFSPKWVLVRLVLLTNVKFQKKKKHFGGFGSFSDFRIVERDHGPVLPNKTVNWLPPALASSSAPSQHSGKDRPAPAPGPSAGAHSALSPQTTDPKGWGCFLLHSEGDTVISSARRCFSPEGNVTSSSPLKINALRFSFYTDSTAKRYRKREELSVIIISGK